MKFTDWFAGIGGFRLGLERAGMECVASCEIDKSPRRMYAKRFGEQPTWADIRDVDPDVCAECWPPPAVPRADLWCGGFPCQDLSVAGKGAGLEGSRSGLWWEWMRLIERHTPRWLLIENVPGLLSSNGGKDFGFVMASLAKVGYDAIWRILDAQFFGVAQQRRRVYIVGYFGDECPPEILFEPEGSGWNPPPRGKTGTDVAHSLDRCTGGPSGKVNQQTFVASVAGTVRTNMRNNSNPTTEAKSLVLAQGNGRASKGDRIYRTDEPARSLAATSGGLGAATGLYLAPTIRCTDPKQGGPGDTIPIVFQRNRGDDGRGYGRVPCMRTDGKTFSVTGAERTNVCAPADADGMRTAAGIPGRLDMYVPGTALGGCTCADGPRYRGLGNAVAVPVIEWIGKRIMNYADGDPKDRR